MVRLRAYGVLPTLLLVTALATPAAALTTIPPTDGPVDLGGAPTQGSTDPANPTTLEAGLWADTLTGPGSAASNAHWFRYQRTMRFSSVLVGVSATSAVGGDGISIEVMDRDGESCGSLEQDTSDPQALGAVFGASTLVSGSGPGDTSDSCVTSPYLDLRVARGSSDADGELPFVIRLVEEAPPSSTLDDLPTVLDEPDVPVPVARDSATPKSGGLSFDDAPSLNPGETVSDAVPEGAEHLFKVRLDWGEQLAVAVRIPAQDDEAGAVLGYESPSVDLRLVDPLRVPFEGGHPGASTSDTYGSETSQLFDGTLAVNLANRFESGTMSVPGDYWISVTVATPTADRARVKVPVEVTAFVSETSDDPPEFVSDVQSPDSGPGPAGYSQVTPYLLGPGEFGSDVSGTPTPPESAATADDVRRIAGWAVGGASLVCLLAGLVLLRRRARLSRAATR